jgi:hypothetical protein
VRSPTTVARPCAASAPAKSSAADAVPRSTARNTGSALHGPPRAEAGVSSPSASRVENTRAPAGRKSDATSKSETSSPPGQPVRSITRARIPAAASRSSARWSAPASASENTRTRTSPTPPGSSRGSSTGGAPDSRSSADSRPPAAGRPSGDSPSSASGRSSGASVYSTVGAPGATTVPVGQFPRFPVVWAVIMIPGSPSTNTTGFPTTNAPMPMTVQCATPGSSPVVRARIDARLSAGIIVTFTIGENTIAVA